MSSGCFPPLPTPHEQKCICNTCLSKRLDKLENLYFQKLEEVALRLESVLPKIDRIKKIIDAMGGIE